MYRSRSELKARNSKVVIVGAGPSGIATAIQLKRCSIEPILFEQDEAGGLLRNANLVENYPGFPEGISGISLVELYKEQLINAGIAVNFEKVIKMEFGDDNFLLKTDKRTLVSDITVIASGTIPKKNTDISIPDNVKNSVYYEIYPILGIKNKRIAIIGAGDASFDYALNLSKENKVIILNRSKEVKCIDVLWERCRISDNISYLNDMDVKGINRAGSELVLNCDSTQNSEKIKIDADFVIIAIGRKPCLDYIESETSKNIDALINTGKLYMAGDVNNGIYRQTGICVGDGIKTAMKICRTLRSNFV